MLNDIWTSRAKTCQIPGMTRKTSEQLMAFGTSYDEDSGEESRPRNEGLLGCSAGLPGGGVVIGVDAVEGSCSRGSEGWSC